MAFSTHDIVSDSPTNNFATVNPLDIRYPNQISLSDGNLKVNVIGSYTGYIKPAPANTTIKDGTKCYIEFYFNYPPNNNIASIAIGVVNPDFDRTAHFDPNGSILLYNWNGDGDSSKHSLNTNNSYGAAISGRWGHQSIGAVFVDLESVNKTISWYSSSSGTWSQINNAPIPSNIEADCLFVIYTEYNNTSSGNDFIHVNFGQDPTFGETKPVGNYAFNTAKIYSVFGGSERSANYTVEYSDDNSNWTTAWTGVMSNNTATGIQQGTGGGGSYGTHKYWRYVEGSAVVSHHPRISRIILSDGTNDTNLIVYNYDNSSDVGEYQPGTVAREISEGYTDTKGIGQFFYEPPTGALALCTANLSDFTPTVTGDTPQDYFKALTYTGSHPTVNSVNVGFNPDLIWLKSRPQAYNHGVWDSIRTVTGYEFISTNNTNAQGTSGDAISFITNGFRVLTGQAFNESGYGDNNMVAWCWKAGGPPDLTSSPTKPFAKNGVQYETLSAANITAGTITPTAMSVNTDAGFSIVKITTSNVEANDMSESFPHGLSKTPEFILGKELSGGDPWGVYHKNSNDGSAPTNLQGMALHNTGGTYTNSAYRTYEVTSSLIKIGRQLVEHNNQDAIFYCWHSVEGYSKIGIYTGNGSADGPFVYCGFRPAWVMVKSSSFSNSETNWVIYDNVREGYNVNNIQIYANTSWSEGQSDANTGARISSIDLLSNGFKLRDSPWSTNGQSGQKFIFMAFAEQPFKYSNAR
jgi:hypothetical protein